ncbi:MAG: SpoIID/LytB domain-containing protein, partial [Bacteroidaceae bacterium]
HCQRYQGLTRIIHPNALNAVRETAHQVLTYRGEVCDCRFSKCCGGTTEAYSTCWEDCEVAYLRPVADTDPRDGNVFCNTSDKAILSQVLNDYDLTTTDFYRWKVVYTQAQLQDLLRRRTGRNFGEIKALRPLTIGLGGRISRLLIEGTQTRLVIGKELTIRSALSESHLYSSAFHIETSPTAPDGIPQTFTLNGRGWGHGVGLCQIGAAVMANKGYTYKEILQHYYPNTTLSITKH